MICGGDSFAFKTEESLLLPYKFKYVGKDYLRIEKDYLGLLHGNRLFMAQNRLVMA